MVKSVQAHRPKCKGFVWERYDRYTGLNPQCRLISAANGKTTGDFISGILKEENCPEPIIIEGCAHFSILNNTNIEEATGDGFSYSMGPLPDDQKHAKSAEDCARRCYERRPRCIGFSWQKPKNGQLAQCHLKYKHFVSVTYEKYHEGVHDTYIYDINEDYLSGILIESNFLIGHQPSGPCVPSIYASSLGIQQLINVSDR